MTTVGGYLEYLGDTQYRRDIMMHVGDIISTVGVFSTVGEKLLSFEYPHGTEHSHGAHDIPHMYHDIPTVVKLQRMLSPTVLNIPQYS